MTLGAWRSLVGMLLFAALGGPAPARAVPMYYTFSAGPLSYTFLLDFEEQGRYALGNPTPMIVSTYPDSWSGDPTANSILARYVSGSALPRSSLDGDLLNEFSQFAWEYAYVDGNRRGSIYDDRLSEFYGGPVYYDWIQVSGACTACTGLWQLGQPFHVDNVRYVWGVPSPEYGVVNADVFLTGISHTAPVPEPSTLILVGVGLLAVGRRRCASLAEQKRP